MIDFYHYEIGNSIIKNLNVLGVELKVGAIGLSCMSSKYLRIVSVFLRIL